MKVWNGYRHGVNIGGWLSQCDHTRERYETFVNEEDFKKISDWGLDHVRIPVDYNLVEDKDGKAVDSGFIYIQRAIDWCHKYGLNMILDLHKTAGFSFDEGENEGGFFENDKYQERFYSLWEKIAKRFGKYESMLAFELLNEVTDKAYCDTWNRISTECITRIRAIAPTIKILVGGYWNNSVAAVKDLPLPQDENIIYNFHCYSPLVFTHQGAGWVREMPHDFRIGFKKTYGELSSACKNIFVGRPDEFTEFEPDKYLDSDYFEHEFKEAFAIAEKRGVPLYCGEYGVIDRADPKDAVEWFRAISKVFERHNVGRAAWSYRQMDFGIDDERYDEVRKELLKLM